MYQVMRFESRIYMYSVTVYMYGSELLTMQIWYEYLVLHSYQDTRPGI